MNSVIFDPQNEYESKYKALHYQKCTELFDRYVKESGLDIELNRETVRLYNESLEGAKKLRKKLFWLKFLRVIMIITIILIPLVIWKTTPKIKALKEELSQTEQKSNELLEKAKAQMLPFNSLFNERTSLELVDASIPLLSFEERFSVEQELDMKHNYDFIDYNESEQSTVDVLSGNYNGNPFIFENKLIHTMGTETYYGRKTIHWTEHYRDTDGKMKTRSRSQTLEASVTKPKPFYSTRVVLNYCSQAAPDLEFRRVASHVEQKSEKQLERHIKRGEKKIQKKENKALKNNSDFTGMANSEFEVLFNALDRTHEVQFRELFSPLAQTNLVSLILSKTGFGDDFEFVKLKRTNRITANHSQGRPLILSHKEYISYSYDIEKELFFTKNTEFFKAVYFDFAPILAVPAYQERPVHSLNPLPDYDQLYSHKESEALANLVSRDKVAHKDTKTSVIIKAAFAGAKEGIDKAHLTAYSYDIIPRVDTIPVYGDDGRYHNVDVKWDEYIPLEAESDFFVSTDAIAKSENVHARRNGLCIFS